ncbi:MAG TPA: hypothetical protein VM056_00115 [Terriglobales bacterium]|nr:hypothetical protein [Terriglobales bacterium]
MEVHLETKMMATCHPEDLWQVFRRLQDWHTWNENFGSAGWVYGEPWQRGSRFFIELLKPYRIDLEVVVLRCSHPDEVVLICHGGGLAAELWIHFTSDDWSRSQLTLEAAIVGISKLSNSDLKIAAQTIIDRWFEALGAESAKHCELIAL